MSDAIMVPRMLNDMSSASEPYPQSSRAKKDYGVGNSYNNNNMDDGECLTGAPEDNPRLLNASKTERFVSIPLVEKRPLALKRVRSCPEIKYDDCREFDAFAGEWIDSKGQQVLISPWGVIRYPNNPKLRFEAIYMGPNHLSVTFDKDPKRRKFVGKLNHECELLIWSNDTKWAKKGLLYISLSDIFVSVDTLFFLWLLFLYFTLIRFILFSSIY